MVYGIFLSNYIVDESWNVLDLGSLVPNDPFSSRPRHQSPSAGSLLGRVSKGDESTLGEKFPMPSFFWALEMSPIDFQSESNLWTLQASKMWKPRRKSGFQIVFHVFPNNIQNIPLPHSGTPTTKLVWSRGRSLDIDRCLAINYDMIQIGHGQT